MSPSSKSGLYVEAPSLERLFISSALQLIEQEVSLRYVTPSERFTLSLSSDSPHLLLVSWLNRVIDFFNLQRFLPRQIYFNGFDGKNINAILIGEKYNPIKHGHIESMLHLKPEEVHFQSFLSGDNSFSLRLENSPIVSKLPLPNQAI